MASSIQTSFSAERFLALPEEVIEMLMLDESTSIDFDSLDREAEVELYRRYYTTMVANMANVHDYIFEKAKFIGVLPEEIGLEVLKVAITAYRRTPIVEYEMPQSHIDYLQSLDVNDRNRALRLNPWMEKYAQKVFIPNPVNYADYTASKIGNSDVVCIGGLGYGTKHHGKYYLFCTSPETAEKVAKKFCEFRNFIDNKKSEAELMGDNYQAFELPLLNMIKEEETTTVVTFDDYCQEYVEKQVRLITDIDYSTDTAFVDVAIKQSQLDVYQKKSARILGYDDTVPARMLDKVKEGALQIAEEERIKTETLIANTRNTVNTWLKTTGYNGEIVELRSSWMVFKVTITSEDGFVYEWVRKGTIDEVLYTLSHVDKGDLEDSEAYAKAYRSWALSKKM